MSYALEELGKGVREIRGDKILEDQLSLAISVNHPRYSLLDWATIDQQFRKNAENFADQMGDFEMRMHNPAVMGYLQSTKLRTFTKRTTSKKHPGTHEWRMQAWCAAFVNWCLIKADCTHLNSPTAASWIKYGRPEDPPRRGAIVVFRPAPAWEVQGGSGHVGFFGGFEGHAIWVLGGNQSHGKVTWSRHGRNLLRGFRWPVAVSGDFPITARNLA